MFKSLLSTLRFSHGDLQDNVAEFRRTVGGFCNSKIYLAESKQFKFCIKKMPNGHSRTLLSLLIGIYLCSSRNLSRWRHLLVISDFLFNGKLWSDVRINVFSSTHRWHFFRDGWYVCAEETTVQFISNGIPLFFKVYIYLDKLVLFRYFSWRKDCWWLL